MASILDDLAELDERLSSTGPETGLIGRVVADLVSALYRHHAIEAAPEDPAPAAAGDEGQADAEAGAAEAPAGG